MNLYTMVKIGRNRATSIRGRCARNGELEVPTKNKIYIARKKKYLDQETNIELNSRIISKALWLILG